MSVMADLASLAELDHQQAKEIVSAQTNIELTTLRGGFAVEQELLQLENLIRTEATLRLEIYNSCREHAAVCGTIPRGAGKGRPAAP